MTIGSVVLMLYDDSALPMSSNKRKIYEALMPCFLYPFFLFFLNKMSIRMKINNFGF